MSTRIENHLALGHLEADAGVAIARAGVLGGQQVRVKDMASVLEDAREEISLHHSEKAEAKEFVEREIGGGVLVRVMRVEEVQAYLEATKRFRDPRELADIVRRLQSSARPGELARGASNTTTQRHALLQLALSDARKRGLTAEVSDRLEEALEALEHEFGDEIRAGYNTAAAAAEFATTAEGVETFQQVYADIVLGESSFAQTLTAVLRRLAGARGEDFGRGLQALLNALGADLKAERSSADPTRLRALVEDVYQLEVAGTVLEGCTQLSQLMGRLFRLDGVIPMELMQELVAMTSERWITPQRWRELAERWRIERLKARIVFHTGTKTLLRKMPVKVFADADARQAVLTCLQQVLDEEVAEEEEECGP
jgi:type III secretion protein W